MKKIITSLSIIAITAAVVAGSTGAFFTDSEESKDNRFVAGTIDLQIDSHCTYNGEECINGYWAGTSMPCNCNWDTKNLTPDDHLFNFSDIKPGDFGENTISLHGTSNDAFIYATINTVTDSDETCVEPELEAEPNCGNDNGGELDDNLYIVIWDDMGSSCGTPGDNEYDPTCETILKQGYANELDGEEIYIGELNANSTHYIGMAWCVGTMTIDPNTGAMSCDGSNVGNDMQTDKYVADILFEAEQQRHNTPRP